jgi:glycosyltransferase involved in cell wall biosynthesis
LKISACIICHNEEARIERALQSLDWADEIVVVDSFSSDSTPKLSRRYTDHFFQRAWSGHADQREFAMAKATHDWIFFLDADEFCTPELVDKLKAFKSEDAPEFKLYKIHRKEHMFGKWIKYGCSNPSYQDRLFNKTGIHFIGAVHEHPKFDGPVGWVHEYIHHDSFDSIEDMLDKLNHYSTLEAEAKFESGVRRHWTYMFFSGLAMFLKGFFTRRGFLDGPHGFIMATFDGLGFFMRQAKLWRLWYLSDRKKLQ